MARHIWTLLCNNASIDSENQTVSIFQILEELLAQVVVPHGSKLPDPIVVPLAITIVSMWERSSPTVEEDKETMQVRIIDPDGKEMARTEQVFSLLGAHVRSRSIIRLQQMPVKDPGRYAFRVFARKGRSWTNVAEIPLQVKIIATEAPPANVKPS